MTSGRWNVCTLQDLGKRRDGFGPQPAAKRHRADAPGYDATLLALPGGLAPQPGKLSLRRRELGVPIGLLSHEHLPGDHTQSASGGPDRHVAMLPLAEAPEEGAERARMQVALF
jgi:hypothetical protein